MKINKNKKEDKIVYKIKSASPRSAKQVEK